MSFVIDEAKIAKMMRDSKPGYVTSATDIGPIVDNHAPYYNAMAGVSGTVTVDRESAMGALREHLVVARWNIEKSGTPLRSADELVKEIDEMRGGNR